MKSRFRKRAMRTATLCGIALVSACTYGIVLDAGGQSVTTDWRAQRVASCRDIGKVTVSVMSRVGPIDRNDIKVRDELEIMARNQAAQMRADTIAPLGDPRDGEQSWEAYSCGTVAPQAPMPAASPAQGNGAPVEEVAPPANAPQDAYPDSGSNPDSDSAPPPGYPTAPQDQNAPQPFSAPAPAGSGAQTYPMSGSSG